MPTNDHRNVRFVDKNIAFDGNYFYNLDNSTNTIVQKTDDGTIAFSYPLNFSASQEVITMHYEGKDRPSSLNGGCFWTLENRPSSAGITIRRIVMDNFLGKQSGVNTSIVDITPITITLTNASGNNVANGDVWSVNQIAVEFYETKLLDVASHNFSPGQTQPGVNSSGYAVLRIYDDLTNNLHGTKQFVGSTTYPSAPALKTSVEPGMNKSQNTLLQTFKYDNGNEIITSGMKMVIGPDSSGNYETVSVQSLGGHYSPNDAVGNPVRYLDINLQSNLSRSYPEGTCVRFYKNIYIFNNNGTPTRAGSGSASGGALYIINDSGNIVKYVASSEYANVTGAVFSQRDRKVIFTKAANAIYLEPNTSDLRIVKTALLDNIQPDEITIIPIYGLSSSYSGMLFRLQTSQTFNGSLESFSGTYNYVLTATFPLVTSISIRPVPQIISANNADIATITVSVKDQFNNPVDAGIPVVLTENDNTGGTGGQGGVFVNGIGQEFNATITLNTDSNGQVSVNYRAGDNNTDVTLGATVQQLTS